MHVLIAGLEEAAARRFRFALSALGHVVGVAETVADVRDACEQAVPPEVALVGDVAPAWLDVLSRVPGHVYTIAVLEDLAPRRVQAAWDAGVDDVTTVRANATELAGRVDAIRRIRRWVARMGEDFAVSGESDLDELAAIRNLSAIAAEELSGMLGSTLTPYEVETELPVLMYTDLRLVLPERRSEVVISVGLPVDSIDAISTRLFGEVVDAQLIADAVRECANTVGGAVKRAALADGVTFALGLPRDANPQPDDTVRTWRLEGTGMAVALRVAVRAGRPRRVSTAMLREGMVLTEPIRSGAGAIYVARGAVLTERTVERLVELLGPDTLVDVARAA